VEPGRLFWLLIILIQPPSIFIKLAHQKNSYRGYASMDGRPNESAGYVYNNPKHNIYYHNRLDCEYVYFLNGVYNTKIKKKLLRLPANQIIANIGLGSCHQNPGYCIADI